MKKSIIIIITAILVIIGVQALTNKSEDNNKAKVIEIEKKYTLISTS